MAMSGIPSRGIDLSRLENIHLATEIFANYLSNFCYVVEQFLSFNSIVFQEVGITPIAPYSLL
jgi:hypothetical protein